MHNKQSLSISPTIFAVPRCRARERAHSAQVSLHANANFEQALTNIQRIVLTNDATRFGSTAFASLPSFFNDDPTMTPSAKRR